MKKAGETSKLVSYRKKALSPVVATVLLVALAVLLILIILLLFRSFIKEVVEKNEAHAKYSCEKVNLEVELSGDDLQIVNRGNIPVHKVAVKKIKKGGSDITVSDVIGSNGLAAGDTASITIGSTSGYTKLNIIPIVLGTVKGAVKEYQCPDEYGKIYEL